MTLIGGGTGVSVAQWRELCAAGQVLCASGAESAEHSTLQLINAVFNYHQLPAPPQVVCLCGSTRNLATFLDWQRILTMHGVIVLTIGYVMSDKDGDPDVGKAMDELHLRKIDISDVVMVLDVNGYIGDSTRGEIEYAKETNKTVILLSEKYATYKSPNLEQALECTFATHVGCKYDEDAGCHVGTVKLDRK